MIPGPMERVELVDDGPASDAGGDRSAPAAHRGQGALRRWWPVAVLAAVALVGAAGVAQLLADRAEHGRIAALASVPHILRPLDGPQGVRWTAPIEGSVEYAPAGHEWVLDGRVVVAGGSRDEGVQLVARDPADGSAEWRRTLVVPGRSADLAGGVFVGCVAPDRDPGDALLVCNLVRDTGLLDPGDARRPAQLVVIEGATGDIVRTRTSDPDLFLEALGADVVLAQPDAAAGATVTREDPVTGDVRWSTVIPPPLVPAAGPQMYVTDGRPVVVRTDRTSVLDPDDGSVATEVVPGAVLRRAGDRWLAQRYEAGPSAGTTLAVLDDDGLLVRRLDVLMPRLSVDDGSVPDVVVAQQLGLTLYGTDIVTGEQLWHLPAAGTGSNAVLVDGQVAVAARSELRAVDVRTGARTWTTRTGDLQDGVATDGRTLVVVEEDGAGPGRLVAGYDLADGRRLWAEPVPAGLTHLRAVGGYLLADVPGGVALLGPTG